MAYKTQADVEKAITKYVALGIGAEKRRDRAAYESAEYWKQHDIAMKWFLKAESLMPKARR